eukprot:TRINITY_DN349_c0_g1_i1.p1 TRINITY_DN349_c0_g1~~TRINITY_DN349_c0_g1_i1.p1  ORF type:complete len:65 (-),score=4.61 TRINITY_DN349_c0_g1_i1:248-442(-)
MSSNSSSRIPSSPSSSGGFTKTAMFSQKYCLPTSCSSAFVKQKKYFIYIFKSETGFDPEKQKLY